MKRKHTCALRTCAFSDPHFSVNFKDVWTIAYSSSPHFIRSFDSMWFRKTNVILCSKCISHRVPNTEHPIYTCMASIPSDSKRNGTKRNELCALQHVRAPDVAGRHRHCSDTNKLTLTEVGGILFRRHLFLCLSCLRTTSPIFPHSLSVSSLFRLLLLWTFFYFLFMFNLNNFCFQFVSCSPPVLSQNFPFCCRLHHRPRKI